MDGARPSVIRKRVTWEDHAMRAEISRSKGWRYKGCPRNEQGHLRNGKHGWQTKTEMATDSLIMNLSQAFQEDRNNEKVRSDVEDEGMRRGLEALGRSTSTMGSPMSIAMQHAEALELTIEHNKGKKVST